MISGIPLVSILLLLPVVAALGLWGIGSDAKQPGNERLMRWYALGVSLIVFLISLLLLAGVSDDHGFFWTECYSWIPTLGIRYHVGVDGISIFLVLLTTFLLPIVILSSFREITHLLRGYFVCLLLLESFIIGALVSLDLFLFYLFWEAMLIPMFILIGIWGGSRRLYATIKFVLYTVVGSFLMLAAFILLYIENLKSTGYYSADYFDLLKLSIPLGMQIWLFLGFAVSFAIKVPMVPLHTWLPDAHTEAPTAGSVILAGILLKMGTYGFIRFAIPLFPEAAKFFSNGIMVLAVIGIIYGAIVAWVQTDVKKLVAYSSVSHLGFVMLGLFSFSPEGLNGAVYQMLNHGVSTGGLFLLVGILYSRAHTRQLNELGGLAGIMPRFAFFMVLIVLSSAALPGLNGFVGEFLILLGTFTSNHTLGWLFAAFAGLGVILSAVYLLHMTHHVLYGSVKKANYRTFEDLSIRELATMLPITVMVISMGLAPNLFLPWINQSALSMLNMLGVGR